MTRLTDRGYYAALALSVAATLAILTALVPGVGSVLVVLAKWAALYVVPALGLVALGARGLR